MLLTVQVVPSMSLKRFGVSVPEDLLERFDRLVARRRYVGRSEAIRDAMRLYLSQDDWESDRDVNLAALNIVYRHRPVLMAKLIKMQHDAEAHVMSTVHVHLTSSHCLEILTIRGNRESIQRLADQIGGLSGIEYVRLFTFSLPDSDEDHHHHHDYHL